VGILEKGDANRVYLFTEGGKVLGKHSRLMKIKSNEKRGRGKRHASLGGKHRVTSPLVREVNSLTRTAETKMGDPFQTLKLGGGGRISTVN